MITIIDNRNELKLLFAEYGFLRVHDINEIHPHSTVGKIEEKLDAWKEISLYIREGNYSNLSKKVYNKLGCFFKYQNPNNIRVLITHEESQAVTIEFLKLGFDAYSNDLLECSGKYPDRHLQMDCFKAIEIIKPFFLGMHPECTRLTVAANKYYKQEYAARFPNIHKDRNEAINHFMKCVEALAEVGCGYIENPIGIMSTRYRKPDQVVQPFWFGDKERKATCLWLENLPKLVKTNEVKPEIIRHKSGRTDSKLHFETLKLPKEERRKARSKTFTGLAKAISEQWGNVIKAQK